MGLTKEEIMEMLQKTNALRKGHFKLTSGLHSEGMCSVLFC